MGVLLWMSYLFFGLATCGPVINYGTGSVQPYDPWYSGSFGGSGVQSPGFYQAPVAYPGYSTYQGSAPYYSPEQYAAYMPYPESYNMGQYWWADPSNSQSASATNQGPSPGSFFSDVSNLNPVYTVSARSRYQRGKSVFSQSRYVPGKPASSRRVQGPQSAPQSFPQPDPQSVPQTDAEPYSPVYRAQTWGV